VFVDSDDIADLQAQISRDALQFLSRLAVVQVQDHLAPRAVDADHAGGDVAAVGAGRAGSIRQLTSL
jgi:hypothetical protein